MGINAYCPPIIMLDFDCVVAIKDIPRLKGYLRAAGFKVKKHPHTIEIKSTYSDLRIHIQIDNRYERFLKSAKYHNILGYRLKVSSKEDILQGKIWDLDTQRDKLKREKDLLDIKRLIERYPELRKLVPKEKFPERI